MKNNQEDIGSVQQWLGHGGTLHPEGSSGHSTQCGKRPRTRWLLEWCPCRPGRARMNSENCLIPSVGCPAQRHAMACSEEALLRTWSQIFHRQSLLPDKPLKIPTLDILRFLTDVTVPRGQKSLRGLQTLNCRVFQAGCLVLVCNDLANYPQIRRQALTSQNHLWPGNGALWCVVLWVHRAYRTHKTIQRFQELSPNCLMPVKLVQTSLMRESPLLRLQCKIYPWWVDPEAMIFSAVSEWNKVSQAWIMNIDLLVLSQLVHGILALKLRQPSKVKRHRLSAAW